MSIQRIKINFLIVRHWGKETTKNISFLWSIHAGLVLWTGWINQLASQPCAIYWSIFENCRVACWMESTQVLAPSAKAVIPSEMACRTWKSSECSICTCLECGNQLTSWTWVFKYANALLRQDWTFDAFGCEHCFGKDLTSVSKTFLLFLASANLLALKHLGTSLKLKFLVFSANFCLHFSKFAICALLTW